MGPDVLVLTFDAPSSTSFDTPGLVQASAEVARFVGADPDDLFPVANATSACNAVIISVVQAAAAAAARAAAAGAAAKAGAAERAAAEEGRGSAGEGSARGAKNERKEDKTEPLECKRAKYAILMTSLTYPAVKSTIVREADWAGLAVVSDPMPMVSAAISVMRSG